MKQITLCVLLSCALGFPTLVPKAHAEKAPEAPQKEELSTMWTAIALNMIAADVLSLYVPEARTNFTDFADGKEAELMLAGAALYQIPISMIFLSKMLPRKANRIANLVGAGLMASAVVGGGSKDPHYLAIASVELLQLSYVAWKAWTWSERGQEKPTANLSVAYKNESYLLRYGLRF